MKLDNAHAGSGVHATDFYRDRIGLAASNVISAGQSLRAVVGDHVGSETCAETIVRMANNPAKFGGSDNSLLESAAKAAHNLKAGLGVHKVAADHGGGNTCVAVIAAAV